MNINVAIVFFICLAIGFFGRHRKLGFWGHFFSSLLLTPFIGLLLLLASDPRKDDV